MPRYDSTTWHPEELKILDHITDLFAEHNVDPLSGERMLLWLAGASVGTRQCSLTSDHVLGNLTAGWRAAVSAE